MVEGKLLRWLLEGSHLVCITSSAKPSAYDTCDEGDTNGVPARIATRIGKNANETFNLHAETGLLLDLTSHGLLHCFADFTETTRQSPGALKWWVATPHEYDRPILKDDYSVDG
jgi:hypothetical protein